MVSRFPAIAFKGWPLGGPISGADTPGMQREQRHSNFTSQRRRPRGHSRRRVHKESIMTMRMLIDARHREETRVAVVKGNRIEEFDFESVEHKQLKGNIYLAKVTRVEPSLQAAFVDYGGNRHGFLAFSEIHPDYYQIPKADRDALLREEAEHAAEEERIRSELDAREDRDEEGRDDDRDDHEGEEGEEGDQPAEAGTGSDASPVDETPADELRKKRQALRRRYKIQDVIQ